MNKTDYAKVELDRKACDTAVNTLLGTTFYVTVPTFESWLCY